MSIKLPCDKCIHNKVCTTRGGSNQDGVCKYFDEERPQGEWINHRNDNGHNIADCSLCGKATQWHDEDDDGIPRYCWHCGAKMKGGAE